MAKDYTIHYPEKVETCPCCGAWQRDTQPKCKTCNDRGVVTKISQGTTSSITLIMCPDCSNGYFYTLR